MAQYQSLLKHKILKISKLIKKLKLNKKLFKNKKIRNNLMNTLKINNFKEN